MTKKRSKKQRAWADFDAALEAAGPDIERSGVLNLSESDLMGLADRATRESRESREADALRRRIRELEAAGVDVSRVLAALRQTAAERIASNDEALAFFAEIRVTPGAAEALLPPTLTREFDELFARMQEPAVREGTRRGFQADGAVMGKAARTAVRNRPAPPSPAQIVVLAGVNGAGKSSLAGTAIREAGGAYFNPDEAAQELMVRHPALTVAEATAQAWTFGKRLLERAIRLRGDFTFETTLGGETITRLLGEALDAGLDVRVKFLGLASPELHIARVRARVARGGHDIPSARIRARFESSRLNLVRLLPRLTELRVYDNSDEAAPDDDRPPMPTLVLHVLSGRSQSVMPAAAIPAWAKPIVMAAQEI